MQVRGLPGLLNLYLLNRDAACTVSPNSGGKWWAMSLEPGA